MDEIKVVQTWKDFVGKDPRMFVVLSFHLEDFKLMDREAKEDNQNLEELINTIFSLYWLPY